MNLILDHIFIITEPGAAVAEQLADIGLVEGSRNVHPGQGTSNRRFFLYGFTIELLYVSDVQEAINGAGKRLGIVQRWRDVEASPFGIVVRNVGAANVANDTKATSAKTPPPFPGWQYVPDYFDGKMAFLIGENSELLKEPLCICMPPSLAKPSPVPSEYANPDWQLTALEIDLPTDGPSGTLRHFAAIDKLELNVGKPHKMTMKFNNNATGSFENLFPYLPLVLQW